MSTPSAITGSGVMSLLRDAESPNQVAREPDCLYQISDLILRGTHGPRLDGISLTIPCGRVAIVGSSGAGKTSLLNVLAGFETPNAGSVRRCFAGVNRRTDRLTHSGLLLYWVPQNGGLWPHLTVQQHLEAVQKNAEYSDEILNLLNLETRRLSFPSELSMGERSRLAVARAVAARAEVLVMDEPLSHVDPIHKRGYWHAVRHFIDQSQSHLIFSSHEPETVLLDSESVICLDQGRVVFSGPTPELYHSPPSQMAGEFLGTLNWFTVEEHAIFLKGISCQPGEGKGIRPARTLLVADAESELEIVSTRSLSACMESVIRDRLSGLARRVLHQGSGSVFCEGDRVRICESAAGQNTSNSDGHGTSS